MMIQALSKMIDFDEKISTKKVYATDRFLQILIAIPKGTELPSHISPTDASLLVLEGKIRFEINGSSSDLNTGDWITFGAKEPHSVYAYESAKLLLTR